MRYRNIAPPLRPRREEPALASDGRAGTSERGCLRESFGEAGQMLRRGRWTIAAVTLAVVALVGLYTFVVEPEYEAYSVLLIEDRSPAMASEVLAAELEVAQNDGRRALANQALLLEESLRIARTAARRLLAAGTDPSFQGPVTAVEAVAEETGREPTVTEVAEMLREEYVTVEPGTRPEGSALKVTAKSANPHEAALIADAFAQAYVVLGREVGRRRLASASTFLEHQLSSQKQTLAELEQRIEGYMTSREAGALDEEMRLTITQVAELERQLDAARVEEERGLATLASLESELESVRPRLAAFVASGADTEIEATQERIHALQARLEQIYIANPELRTASTPNPDVAALEQEIAELETRVRRLSDEYVDEVMAVGGTDPLQSEGGENLSYVAQLKRRIAEERMAVLGARAQQETIRSRIARYRQRLGAIPSQSIGLGQLERERETAAEMYVTLDAMLQRVRMAEQAEAGLAEIVRPALVPDEPVRPNRAYTLFFALFLGLGLGVGAAVVRYRIDDRIYTPDDLRARAFTPLGVVPDVQRLPGALRNERRADGPLLPAPARPDAFSDAFRRLHLNLASRTGGLRTLLVTSAEPGAGKSTTALNLAAAAVRAGRRTLLVDADLRRPRLHRLLRRPDAPTLAELLNADEIDGASLATGIPGLYAVGVDRPVDDPDALLTSGALDRLVAELHASFDLVVVDTPPVLAVADALLLARLADAVVVVAGARETDAGALDRTIAELRAVDAPVIGTILNRYDPAADSTGYPYRYYVYDTPDPAAR